PVGTCSRMSSPCSWRAATQRRAKPRPSGGRSRRVWRRNRRGGGRARRRRRTAGPLGGGRPHAPTRPRLPGVPWQPLGGLVGDGLVVALERREVVERISTVELRGVDEGHVHVPYIGTTLASIEQRAVPVLDRHLQRPLANVVVQRGAWHAEEE